MNIDSKLRKLSVNKNWQSIYGASQKCSDIRLFLNNDNYSGIQIQFLYWLSVYEMLFSELSTYEDKLLTLKVLDDEDRTDAYLIYRNKKHDYLWKKHREEEKQTQLQVNRKKNFKNPGKETSINVDLRREE